MDRNDGRDLRENKRHEYQSSQQRSHCAFLSSVNALFFEQTCAARSVPFPT
jgi:hypothetical protein